MVTGVALANDAKTSEMPPKCVYEYITCWLYADDLPLEDVKSNQIKLKQRYCEPAIAIAEGYET